MREPPTDEELREAAFEAKYGFPELDEMTDEELERELVIAEIALAEIEIRQVSDGITNPEQIAMDDKRFQRIYEEI